MPIYAFHIDVPLPPSAVAERLRTAVCPETGPGDDFWSIWRSDSGSLVGSVRADSFRLKSDIGISNSFQPLIKGKIVATPTGTRITAFMFVHPVVAIFVLFWLGFTGYGAIMDRSQPSAVWGMFAFGVALVSGGFFPGAIQARNRIITTVSAFHLS